MENYMLDDSILETVRKLVGGEANGDAFDQDLIVHINSIFERLYTLGVGPSERFAISDSSSKWSDFIDGPEFISCLSYVSLRTRLKFDPPTSSSVANALNEEVHELEWILATTHDGIYG